MLEICKKLFTDWNQYVRYCHWKSNEHLEEGLCGDTDLDVFVFPEDKDKCEVYLRSNEYIKFRTQKGSKYPNVDEWIGFDSATGRLVHVHLHYRIITGTKFCKEYEFPVSEKMIETRVLDPTFNVYVTTPELELIILYARIILKCTKHTISPTGYEKEIAYLKAILDTVKLNDLCIELLGCKIGSQYASLICEKNITNEQWKQLKIIVKQWLQPYKTISSFKCFFRTRYYWFRHYYYLVLSKKLHKPCISKKTLYTGGLSICFIGQDGCGKSTLTKEIEKWLRWKIEAHRFYLGSGDGNKSLFKWLLGTLAKVKNRKNSQSHSGTKTSVSSVASGTTKKGILNEVSSILVSFGIYKNAHRAEKEINKSVKYSRNGGISLFDRFPQVQFRGLYDGPKIRSIYIENGINNFIVKHFAKKEEGCLNRIQQHQPTIVFKLMLSPEESIRRKPFENYEQVKMKNVITEQLVFNNSSVYTIDATQPYKEELIQVKNIIWQHILKSQLL